jgi:hypothetical protein
VNNKRERKIYEDSVEAEKQRLKRSAEASQQFKDAMNRKNVSSSSAKKMNSRFETQQQEPTAA